MRWLLIGLTLALACGDDSNTQFDGGTDGGKSDVTISYANVTVNPPNVTLTVPLEGTVTQAYTVLADVGGQMQVDVTSQCTLAVADASLGMFGGALFTSTSQGGDTTVTATCGNTNGSTPLHLLLKGYVLGMGAPANAPSIFSMATVGSNPADTPSIEYPLDKAIAPLNIPAVDSQWTTASNDLFHLSYTSPHIAIDLYTLSADAQFADNVWSAIAASAAGDAISISVEGLVQASPSTKYASAPITLTMSHDKIDNTAIYWWASSLGSLMSQTFGDTGAPTVVKDDCTSCHSVSRSGSRIGYSRCVGGNCGTLYGGFMKYDTTNNVWNDTLNADNETQESSYSTFAPVGNPFPDDSQAVSLVAMASCNLTLVNPDTGAGIASNVDAVSTHMMGNPGRCATMPDWSPDGKSVVFASTPNAGQWIDVSNSAIALMSYVYSGGTHTFGEPTIIIPGPITLPSGTYNNFFFPSFSPDNAYIVFDAARAAWRNFTVAASPGERLMLTVPSGTWAIELAGLNGSGDLDTTWPHWAPTTSTDYYWVVFSTERDYGHLKTQANTAPSCVANGVQQCKQIWISAISKSTLGAKTPPDDPSSPPMWMPGQDIGADNISPYWTVPTNEIPH
jgi:WD40-like Beta Propeller Repeat